MELSERELEKIERLAMIRVHGGSRERLRAQISEIIGFVRQLQQIDTREYEAEGSPDAGIPSLRDDEPGDCLPRDEALSAAPDTRSGMFRVPGIMGIDQDS